MFEKLKTRWNVRSNWELAIIFFVFSIAGSTSLFIRRPIFHLFDIDKDVMPLFDLILVYIMVVSPSYLVLLLFWGTLLGQWKFFWDFEKKMYKRFILIEIVVALIFLTKLFLFS